MIKYQITISCEKGKLAKALRELAETLSDERYVIGHINDKKYTVNIKEIKKDKDEDRYI
jgi:uncharacterized membrane protein